jgi:hypothetical protein
VLEFILNYWLEALMGIVFTAISVIVKKLYKKQKAIENGVQALLRNELIRRYREFEIKGEMTILDKENMEFMFTEYQNLGGNGMVKQMYDEMLAMPTKIIK